MEKTALFRTKDQTASMEANLCIQLKTKLTPMEYRLRSIINNTIRYLGRLLCCPYNLMQFAYNYQFFMSE